MPLTLDRFDKRGELLATDDAGLSWGGHGCLAIIKSGISLALKARNWEKVGKSADLL